MEFTKDIEFNHCPTAQDNLTLIYRGYLNHSPDLTIVYGFGKSWHHTTETPMTKTSSGFSVEIKMLDFDTFNFCFKNSNNEWDNNSNCNYISPILPCEIPAENVQKFDIDALIEEILEPLTFQKQEETETSTLFQTTTEPVDLGIEITNILSQINWDDTDTETGTEYTTLDEILTGTIIEEIPIELLENEPTPEPVLPTFEKQTALINIEDPFTISPRKLSTFYLFRKRLKLSFYKLLKTIPKLIFGSEEN